MVRVGSGSQEILRMCKMLTIDKEIEGQGCLTSWKSRLKMVSSVVHLDGIFTLLLKLWKFMQMYSFFVENSVCTLYRKDRGKIWSPKEGQIPFLLCVVKFESLGMNLTEMMYSHHPFSEDVFFLKYSNQIHQIITEMLFNMSSFTYQHNIATRESS